MFKQNIALYFITAKISKMSVLCESFHFHLRNSRAKSFNKLVIKCKNTAKNRILSGNQINLFSKATKYVSILSQQIHKLVLFYVVPVLILNDEHQASFSGDPPKSRFKKVPPLIKKKQKLKNQKNERKKSKKYLQEKYIRQQHPFLELRI